MLGHQQDRQFLPPACTHLTSPTGSTSPTSHGSFPNCHLSLLTSSSSPALAIKEPNVPNPPPKVADFHVSLHQLWLTVTWSISMIFSLVSMTMMSSFSGSACFTLPSGAAAMGVTGKKPPPRSTTCVISSPTPWMDRITLLPRKGQGTPRSWQHP